MSQGLQAGGTRKACLQKGSNGSQWPAETSELQSRCSGTWAGTWCSQNSVEGDCVQCPPQGLVEPSSFPDIHVLRDLSRGNKARRTAEAIEMACGFSGTGLGHVMATEQRDRHTWERPWGELPGKGVEFTLKVLHLLPLIFQTPWFPLYANPDDWRSVSNAVNSFTSNCHWIYMLTRFSHAEISLKITGFYFTFGSLLWREPFCESSSAQHMTATASCRWPGIALCPSCQPWTLFIPQV